MRKATAPFASSARFETAEALAATRRWQTADLDEWLLTRLKHRWQGQDLVWRNKLANIAASNEFLFIMNNEAVLVAMTMRDVLSGGLFVMERFAFSRKATYAHDVYSIGFGDPAEAAMRALYRFMYDWAKSQKATRIYVGTCSDMLTAQLAKMLGDSAYELIAAPVQ